MRISPVSFTRPQDIPLLRGTKETVFHVTVLSNFARAYDKYSRRYDKRAIAESTYPVQFFLLRRQELALGLEKASRLLSKLDLEGDRLIALETEVLSSLMEPNARTGRGRYVRSSSISLQAVHWADGQGVITKTTFEEVYAQSLSVLNPALKSFQALAPRSFSILPVARACQARCRFCFSESSASQEQSPSSQVLASVAGWARKAKEQGAQRMVITGGGEPGLLQHDQLLDLIRLGTEQFQKTVLITNGVHLARASAVERESRIRGYANSGLSVLAISRHHHDPRVNEIVMGLDTRTELVAQSVTAMREKGERPPVLRLICVLQKEGVAGPAEVESYLKWAADCGVDEVCFKELYVSTSLESKYHLSPENKYSERNQVSLGVVLEAMHALGFQKEGELPWGAPYFAGSIQGKSMRIAAYTEPSVFWERSTGTARSWNLMADGSCLASLEDPASALVL